MKDVLKNAIFLSLDVAKYCCTIFKMHDVYSVCFVNTDFRSLTLTCIIIIHAVQMSCMWIKDGVHFKLIVGSSVGCPRNCPLFPYLKVVGYPLSCPLSCPLYPYMAVVDSLICMAKFPWAAHSAANWAARFFQIWKNWAVHWAAHCFHIWK